MLIVPQLDSLPTELIQRIASYLDATSVLQLLSVNRTLSQACWDKHVFQAVIDYDEILPWVWPAAPAQSGHSAESWARRAVASERAIVMMGKELEEATSLSGLEVGFDSQATSKYVVTWLPQLIASKRK
jgi:hypothetical protein